MKAIMNSVLYFAYELLESLSFEFYEQGLFRRAKIADKIAEVVTG